MSNSAIEYPGNVIPAPGYWKGNETEDDELLYSTARFTQKGVTLKAGQGVLLLGTPLAYEAATKRWVKYDAAGVGTTDAARGLLRQTVDTGASATYPAPVGGHQAPPTDAKELQGNIVLSGIVKNSKVAAALGVATNAIPADVISDLNAKSDTVLDTFTF